MRQVLCPLIVRQTTWEDKSDEFEKKSKPILTKDSFVFAMDPWIHNSKKERQDFLLVWGLSIAPKVNISCFLFLRCYFSILVPRTFCIHFQTGLTVDSVLSRPIFANSPASSSDSLLSETKSPGSAIMRVGRDSDADSVDFFALDSRVAFSFLASLITWSTVKGSFGLLTLLASFWTPLANLVIWFCADWSHVDSGLRGRLRDSLGVSLNRLCKSKTTLLQKGRLRSYPLWSTTNGLITVKSRA